MNPALILRALASARRPVAGKTARLQVEGGVPLDSRRLDAYARWLGVPEAPVPTPFLFVLCQPLHLDLLLRARVPVLGAVHLEADLRRGSGALGDLMARTTLDEGEPLAGRRTLWLRTSLTRDGVPWGIVHARYGLRPPGGPRPPTEAPKPSPLPALAHAERPIPWGAGAGRTYARVSGDFNPIHLSGTTARWFGQKAAILHGMAAAAVAWRDLGAGDVLRVRFRKPLPLPGSSSLHHEGSRFEIRSGDNRVLFAEGELEAP